MCKRGRGKLISGLNIRGRRRKKNIDLTDIISCNCVTFVRETVLQGKLKICMEGSKRGQRE